MDKTGYLDRLYVHKNFQGIGITTALIHELEQRAREQGILYFTTNSSITAKSFFQKHGYQVEAENKIIRNGITLINYKMRKHYQMTGLKLSFNKQFISYLPFFKFTLISSHLV